MSDVPVAACWLLALSFALRRVPDARVLAAGVMTGIAILVRPNLAPLAAIVLAAVIAASRSGRGRRTAVFLAPVLVAIVLLAWIQRARYGSPLASGYGDVGFLFAASSIVPNLQRYPRWLTETHTPFIWLWLLAPVFVLRQRAARLAGWLLLTLIVAVFAAYLPYAYFQPDEWHYTRYLLPAVAPMLMLGVAVLLAWVRRAPAAVRSAVLGLMIAGLTATFVRAAERRDVFRLRTYERKYPIAGAFVRDTLPANAFVLAGQHSGSVRHYAGRPILRWDLLDPAALDAAIAALRATGHTPFAVLDPFEYDEFRRRFEAARQDAVSSMRLVAVPADVRVYAFE